MTEPKKPARSRREKQVRGVYASDDQKTREARGEESAFFRLNPTDAARRRELYPGLTLTETLRLWVKEKLRDTVTPSKDE